jgi:LmbE family N-acetylglucosaminyl deacetylase
VSPEGPNGGEEAARPELPGPALAVFAHPDDAEISAGATLAKWAAGGREVHLLVLTNGDRGSQDRGVDRAELARVRAAETVEGARVLGLASATVLDVPDGELENTPPIQAEVVRAIRRIRPTTILSCDPTAWFFDNRYYNHSDHRTAGLVALDAAFPGAGNPHFFSDHLDEGLDPHDVTSVWLGWTLEPNHREDVTGYLEAKLAALAEHASQLADGIRFFEDELTAEAERAGAELGVRHAEAFRVLELG